ncbi:UNVERIFIED_ORG: putative membrane protein (TIGR02234 family) [Gordonia westfalica J30]
MTSAEHEAPQTTPKSSRRPQMIAAILMLATAAAFWGASRLTWAIVSAEDGLSPQRAFDVKGADWSPWLTPLALVYLAGIAAVLSVRGWGLRLVALLVAAGGVLAAFPAISLIAGGTDSEYAADAGDIPDRYVVLYTDSQWLPAALVLLGTVCAVAAAVVLLRVAKGATMSSKYKTPAARREELETEIFADYERRKKAAAADATKAGDTPVAGGAATGGKDGRSADDPDANERMMWDALDTGIDPTDPSDPDDR